MADRSIFDKGAHLGRLPGGHQAAVAYELWPRVVAGVTYHPNNTDVDGTWNGSEDPLGTVPCEH